MDYLGYTSPSAGVDGGGSGLLSWVCLTDGLGVGKKGREGKSQLGARHCASFKCIFDFH